VIADVHSDSPTLLEIRNLRTYFKTLEGTARAVDGVSFEVYEQRTIGLVGESGSGKTMTALSILRLVPEPPGKIIDGKIFLRGKDLLALPTRELRRIRGNDISMIFQEPMTSFNPVYTIGSQISEVLRLHQGMTRRQAREESIRLLDRVRIPSPEQRVDDYPHQLSGGMLQRAMIAMALACKPALLIADEPTTALDVTVQAQVLDLMKELQEEFQTAILIITHNFGIIAEIADSVLVMYAGMIVEEASTTELFNKPLHPYTRLLLESMPNLERVIEGKDLSVIPGMVPDPVHYPAGCRFHPRCPLMTPECIKEIPPMEEVTPGHKVRCIHWDKQ